MKLYSAQPASLTLDDIVFANRNQAYGAYELRQAYRNALLKAVLLGTAVFLALFIVPILYKSFNLGVANDAYMTEMRTIKVELPPPPKEDIPLPEPIEKPKAATVRSVELEVVKDEKVVDETPPPTVDELEKADPGQITQAGTGDAEVEIVAPPADEPAPAVTKSVEVEARPEPIFERVEVDPAFPGGTEAFRSFLTKHLKYPPAASRSGIQGRVYMQFTVEPDGSLSSVNVVRGIGFGCDEEALRVVRLMPPWKPGRQSGRAVRVKFNLPIVFALE